MRDPGGSLFVRPINTRQWNNYYLSRKPVERQINRIVRQAIDEYRKTEEIE